MALRLKAMNLLLVLLLAITACRGQGAVPAPTAAPPTLQTQKVPVEGGGSYTDVSAAGLASMLKNKDFVFINVHVPYEGEIDSTDLFVPYDQVEANLARLPADKNAKLLPYCRTGGMSAIAARKLVQLGYTNVWNLDGGMVGWEQAGYPLLQRQR